MPNFFGKHRKISPCRLQTRRIFPLDEDCRSNFRGVAPSYGRRLNGKPASLVLPRDAEPSSLRPCLRFVRASLLGFLATRRNPCGVLLASPRSSRPPARSFLRSFRILPWKVLGEPGDFRSPGSPSSQAPFYKSPAPTPLPCSAFRGNGKAVAPNPPSHFAKPFQVSKSLFLLLLRRKKTAFLRIASTFLKTNLLPRPAKPFLSPSFSFEKT